MPSQHREFTMDLGLLWNRLEETDNRFDQLVLDNLAMFQED
ncbi:MAG: hypothetical protein SV186_07010 [Candidatus Nanohaloarchaea archaeon]|nr:hypothetical protein [Candidatus Nanohaloarchaea archaeon]